MLHETRRLLQEKKRFDLSAHEHVGRFVRDPRSKRLGGSVVAPQTRRFPPRATSVGKCAGDEGILTFTAKRHRRPMSSRSLADELLELLFPPRCQVCGELEDEPVCEACLAETVLVQAPICLYCGVPVQEMHQPYRLCGECRDGRWLSGVRALGLHVKALREAVIRFKFEGRIRLGSVFGRMLAETIEAEVDAGGLPLDACAALIPVPLHPNRRRWRGFDQAELICDEIARHTGLAVWREAITRVRDTPPQVEVSGSDRRENVQGAFVAASRSKVRGASVILVDDVITTGATMEECALVLRRAGAAAVYGLAVTRGAPGWHPVTAGADAV